jgi:5S rRNA maturation endonuclease (ribonuclease M5)
MKEAQIKQLLLLLNSKSTSRRAGWIEGPCVLGPWRHGGKDNNPSFAIHAETSKKSICKCLSCGFGGDLFDLVFEVRRLMAKSPATGYDLPKASMMVNSEFDEMELTSADIPEYEDAFAVKLDNPFPETFLDQFQPLWQSNIAMNYMMSRNVPLLVCKALNVVWDKHQKRVGFPFRNSAGKLMGVQGRAVDASNELRYYQYGYLGERNMQAWMGEDHLNLDEPVIVCEGPLDNARIFQHYPNVAASFTSGLSVAKIKRLADATDIITFYDHGKGGNAAREKLHSVLTGASIIDIIPTAEEGDAGAMTDDAIREYLTPHVSLTRPNKWNP